MRSFSGTAARPAEQAVPVNPPARSVAEEFRQRVNELARASAWDVGLGLGAALSLLTMVVTAIVGARQFRVDVNAPAPLFFAALALLLLLAWLLSDRTRKGYVNFLRMMGETWQRGQAQDELRHDHLTGTYNRAALREFTEIYLSHASRSHQPLTLIVTDLDNFGELNKRFGHIAGDTALSEFARVLLQSTRGSDIVARYGGDEFVVLLGDTAFEGAEAVVHRVRKALAARNEAVSGAQVPISFTAGLAVYERGMDFPDLFARADADLLHRKSQRQDTPAPK